MVVNDTNTIASRLFAAIEEGDLDAVRDLYSPDVQIWHNVTNRSQTRDENLKLLADFTSAASSANNQLLFRYGTGGSA